MPTQYPVPVKFRADHWLLNESDPHDPAPDAGFEQAWLKIHRLFYGFQFQDAYTACKLLDVRLHGMQGYDGSHYAPSGRQQARFFLLAAMVAARCQKWEIGMDYALNTVVDESDLLGQMLKFYVAGVAAINAKEYAVAIEGFGRVIDAIDLLLEAGEPTFIYGDIRNVACNAYCMRSQAHTYLRQDDMAHSDLDQALNFVNEWICLQCHIPFNQVGIDEDSDTVITAFLEKLPDELLATLIEKGDATINNWLELTIHVPWQYINWRYYQALDETIDSTMLREYYRQLLAIAEHAMKITFLHSQVADIYRLAIDLALEIGEQAESRQDKHDWVEQAEHVALWSKVFQHLSDKTHADPRHPFLHRLTDLILATYKASLDEDTQSDADVHTLIVMVKQLQFEAWQHRYMHIVGRSHIVNAKLFLLLQDEAHARSDLNAAEQLFLWEGASGNTGRLREIARLRRDYALG